MYYKSETTEDNVAYLKYLTCFISVLRGIYWCASLYRVTVDSAYMEPAYKKPPVSRN